VKREKDGLARSAMETGNRPKERLLTHDLHRDLHALYDEACQSDNSVESEAVKP